ncbi:hypothetical protein [Moorena sp. SIO3H5]|nr:hypothetical protein [Moorena sp. SIO3H5]
MTNDYSIFDFNEVHIICTFFPLYSFLLTAPCSLLPKKMYLT